MNTATAIKQLNQLKKYLKNIRLAAESWQEPWQTLIATVLSARTRDEVTIIVSEKLFEKYKTVGELANADIKEVQSIIRPINFYKNKSKSIINCAKVLVQEYNSKPPADEEKLLKLPGVGRKTAGVFLQEQGKDAIGVDTHVFYCARKLGWSNGKTPHEVEKDLKKLFPRKYWKQLNPVLVRFGKTYISRRKQDEILEKLKLVRPSILYK